MNWVQKISACFLALDEQSHNGAQRVDQRAFTNIAKCFVSLSKQQILCAALKTLFFSTRHLTIHRHHSSLPFFPDSLATSEGEGKVHNKQVIKVAGVCHIPVDAKLILRHQKV